jgi:hypothetical protein
MIQSLQAKINGVEFRRPVFQNQLKIFSYRIYKSLEWYGRVRAARHLAFHGYHELAKTILEGRIKQ